MIGGEEERKRVEEEIRGGERRCVERVMEKGVIL